MSPLLTFLLGLALGWMFALPAQVYLARELKVAQDRLLQAWHQGAVVPPRPEAEPTPVELEPLPALLQPFVDRWESKESQMREEAQIRRWLGDGWKAERIAKHFADPLPGT